MTLSDNIGLDYIFFKCPFHTKLIPQQEKKKKRYEAVKASGIQLEGKDILPTIIRLLDYTDLQWKIQQRTNSSYLICARMPFQMAGQTCCRINESSVE